MKKKILSLLLALAAGMAVQAQSFTAVNDDGVTIAYTVTSAANHTVTVAARSYTGRVTVPETVAYNDATWTVTSIGTAFSGTAVTYLGVPATVEAFENGALYNCPQLDTVNLVSTVAPSVPIRFGSPMALGIFAQGNGPTSHLATVVVPCGSLKSYRDNGWEAMPTLTSPCAVPIKVTCAIDSLYRFDSVGSGRYLHYSSGSYEIGDTATVMAERMFVMRDYINRVFPRHGFFIGWDNGQTEQQFSFVVEHADTIVCIADTFHYEHLTASRIATPVFQFGSLSYDGKANYSFPDLTHPAVSVRYEYGDTGYVQVYDTLDYNEVPSTILSTGLWVGSSDSLAYDRDPWLLSHDTTVTARTAVARFYETGTDYFPGPLRLADGGTDMSTLLAFNRVWKVSREMVDYHIAHFADEGYQPAEAIESWPGNGPEGYAEQLAPYFDADSDGVYNPLQGDYPVIRGDECVFSIFNDAYGSHGESGSKPLGIEVHAMTYAFNDPADTALWNTVFQHFDIYNRSAADLPNTFFGAWTDFDLGYDYDDYIACDVSRGMYYAYNGREQDGPGSNYFEGVPPAQGCVILGGATIPSDGQDNPAITIADYPQGFLPDNTIGNMGINGMNFGDGITDNERMGMTSFMYYENSYSSNCGDPSVPTDFYNYLNAYWKNWQHLKYGGNGISYGTTTLNARFMWPGDSDPWHWGTDGVVPDIQTNDWNEETSYNMPGDRRGIAGSGHFNFVAGSCEQFDVAYTTGFGQVDVASSVYALCRNTDNVRRQFQADTTDAGSPFVYRPYVAPRTEGIGTVDAATLQVSPNPTTGRLTVSVPEETDVEVLDMMGRQLMAVHARPGAMALDLTALPQGVYLLRAAGAVSRIVKH